MPAEMFYDSDADLSVIQGRNVAVIGFGSQGHAHALSLRDSGVDVRVGLPRPAPGQGRGAGPAGAHPVRGRRSGPDHGPGARPGPAQAVRRGDRAQPGGRRRAVLRARLQHPLRLHRAAGGRRRGPGRAQGPGSPGPPGVRRGPWRAGARRGRAGRAGKAWDLALSYAKAIGGLRAGGIKTTFTEETETDLFGEQAVLCGGASALVMAGFETLTEAGYQPEVAYFECLHELKLIVDLMYEGGIAKQRWSVSDTAEYGDYVSGPRVIDAHVKENMKAVLADVQNGAFAKRFIDDQDAGAPEFTALREKGETHPIEAVGHQLRGLMAWVKTPRRRLRGGHRRPLTLCCRRVAASAARREACLFSVGLRRNACLRSGLSPARQPGDSVAAAAHRAGFAGLTGGPLSSRVTAGSVEWSGTASDDVSGSGWSCRPRGCRRRPDAGADDVEAARRLALRVTASSLASTQTAVSCVVSIGTGWPVTHGPNSSFRPARAAAADAWAPRVWPPACSRGWSGSAR